jgi:hypothetical protein
MVQKGHPCYCTRSILHCLRIFWQARGILGAEWPNAGAHLLPEAGATQERTL